MAIATEGVRWSKKSNLDTRGEMKATKLAQKVQKVKSRKPGADHQRSGMTASARREFEDERVREARPQRVRMQPVGS